MASPSGSTSFESYPNATAATYESQERLMNKDDVLKSASNILFSWGSSINLPAVCEVVGIRQSTLNNFSPLPVPQLAGAGRVKPFREGQVRKI
jgi:hypothetical protein